MNKVRSLIIIPTYNEAQNVLALIEILLEKVPHADILVVDDNSPDGTADLTLERFSGEKRLTMLRRTGLRGLGRSYVDGYQQALEGGYAQVVQMDADFSHDPIYIPAMVAASENADVVVGSRYCPGGGVCDWPRYREWLSRFANLYVRALLGLPVRDATSGFRCYSRHALECISLGGIVSNGYAFQVEMTYRALQAHLRIVETPILFRDRRKGQSKMSKRIIAEAITLPWRLRSALPPPPALAGLHKQE